MNTKKNIALFFAFIFALTVPLSALATGSFVAGPTSMAEFVDAATYGKVNLSPTNGGVTITSTNATGYAWGENTGWINFGPFNNNSGGVNVSCVGSTATLSGYAWGENTGWINFGPFSGGNTAQQVEIDSSGDMSGYAWAQNAGWLDFNGRSTLFTCTAPPPPPGGSPPTCTISANPNQITTPGSPVTLSWVLSGGASLSFRVAELGSQTYTVNGSATVNPTQTTTYHGTITDIGKSATCNATVAVSSTPQTLGCKNQAAINYNPAATVDNGRCVFIKGKDWDLEYTLVTDAPITSAQCNYFKAYLKKGDRGIEVAKVQNFLNKYNNEILKVDGVFGETTKSAVRRFQVRHYNDIITPWGKYIRGVSTGNWYKTTRGTANIIVGCTPENVLLESNQTTYTFTETIKKFFNVFIGTQPN